MSELAQVIIASACGISVVLVALGVVIAAARNRRGEQ